MLLNVAASTSVDDVFSSPSADRICARKWDLGGNPADARAEFESRRSIANDQEGVPQAKKVCPGVVNNILSSNAIATSIANRNVSYSQFCGGINRVATQLRSLELDRGVAVALIMDRGPELYASQFAVLSTGGFFLPIDPANPFQRIKFLLTDSQTQCVLVDAASAEKIKSLGLDLDVIELGAESVFDDATDQIDP